MSQQEPLSKSDIIKLVIDVYSDKLVSPSLELHMEIFKTIQCIQESKTDAHIKKWLTYIKDLRKRNAIETPQVDFTINQGVTKDIVSDILSRVDIKQHRVLEILRESVASDDIFAMFAYLYHSFCSGGNTYCYNNCREIVSWLLAQSPRKVFQKTQDVMTVAYCLMLHAMEAINSDIKKFVMVSRELSSFKASKAHSQQNRSRLLTMTMYVVITRNMDYSALQKPIDDIKNKYLFVVCQRDMNAIQDVRMDRNKCKHQDAPYKRLQIEDSHAPSRKDGTDIVKIHVK